MEGVVDRVEFTTPPRSRGANPNVERREGSRAYTLAGNCESNNLVRQLYHSTYARRNTEHLEVRCGESRVAAGAFASAPSAALKQSSSSLACVTTT